MANWTVSERVVTRKIFEKRDEKNINQYELSKSENGWYIKYTHFNVDVGFPEVKEMWLPEALIEEIILPTTAKHELEKQ